MSPPPPVTNFRCLAWSATAAMSFEAVTFLSSCPGCVPEKKYADLPAAMESEGFEEMESSSQVPRGPSS